MNKIMDNMGSNVLAGLILAGILGTITVATVASTTSSRVDTIETKTIPEIRQDMREYELIQKDNTKLIVEIHNDIKWLVSRQPK